MSKLESLEDEALVELTRAGNKAAFDVLCERHLRCVYNRLRALLPPEAVEDVTQEVFVAVLESISRYQGQALFRTWLSSITRNKVADFYRRRSRRPEAASLDDEATHKHATFSISEEHTMVRIAVQRLPNHYQEIILLRFTEGLSFAEIAITLEISLEATKSRFRRAVAAAAQEMGLDPKGVENP